MTSTLPSTPAVDPWADCPPPTDRRWTETRDARDALARLALAWRAEARRAARTRTGFRASAYAGATYRAHDALATWTLRAGRGQRFPVSPRLARLLADCRIWTRRDRGGIGTAARDRLDAIAGPLAYLTREAGE